jgi:hypothetical protein
MLILFVLIFSVSCWRNEDPAAQSHRPSTTPRPCRGYPIPPPTPHPPAAYAQTLVPDLSKKLSTDESELIRSISGPLVYLDLDAGTLSVLCGEAAVPPVRAIAGELADRKRAAPFCRLGAAFNSCGISCQQAAPGQRMISLEFDDTDPPRLSDIIVGASASQTRLALWIPRFDKARGSARCPH